MVSRAAGRTWATSSTVIETIPAGAMPTKAIGPNQCARIMTGAAVPQGADCVVMIEQTQAVGRDSDSLHGRADAGQYHVEGRRIFAAGKSSCERAARIRPAAYCRAGLGRDACGRWWPCRPRVAVVAGGDELVAPAARPGPSQIRNSNSVPVDRPASAMGIAARDYGIMKDVAGEIDRVLQAALAENDVVTDLRRRLRRRLRSGAGSPAAEQRAAALREDRRQARQADGLRRCRARLVFRPARQSGIDVRHLRAAGQAVSLPADGARLLAPMRADAS